MPTIFWGVRTISRPSLEQWGRGTHSELSQLRIAIWWRSRSSQPPAAIAQIRRKRHPDGGSCSWRHFEQRAAAAPARAAVPARAVAPARAAVPARAVARVQAAVPVAAVVRAQVVRAPAVDRAQALVLPRSHHAEQR